MWHSDNLRNYFGNENLFYYSSYPTAIVSLWIGFEL